MRGSARTLVAVIALAFVLIASAPALIIPIPIFGPFWSTGNLAVKRVGHTTTLLPNGKILVTGGVDETSTALTTAELYDPATGSWALTRNNLTTARVAHTATLMPNGNVLVVGGLTGAGAGLTSAEIYNTSTGFWTTVRSGGLTFGRYNHTATLLQNNKILFCDGSDLSGPLKSAELFDLDKGTWGVTASTTVARQVHTATLLANGKVLVAGGVTDTGVAIASAEVYDPAANNNAGAWTLTGAFTGRYRHTSTLLPSGKVLVAGGFDGTNPLASAQLYDPATGSWTSSPTGSLSSARFYHTASLLPNGKVLVAGGSDNSGPVAGAELYDPAGNSNVGSWAGAGTLRGLRKRHTATLLPSGKVLLTGGGDASSTALASAEFYDVVGPNGPGFWSAPQPPPPLTGNLNVARQGHTSTLLFNGMVLTTGGSGSGLASTTELYSSGTGIWSNTGVLNEFRVQHTATLLQNGNVLVAGGFASSPLNSCELYDQGSGKWTFTTGALRDRRWRHTATLLPSGKVLVAGGQSEDLNAPTFLATAELYDPTNKTWSVAGSMANIRSSHTATLLSNGTVLVAGGDTDGTAEVYDPVTNAWKPAGTMKTNRAGHTATLLPNGKVLVAAGHGAAGQLVSAELYDPAHTDPNTSPWSSTGSLGTSRASHTATLLPSGKVLAVGGHGDSGDVSTSELYDPAKGTWDLTAPVTTARYNHSAVLLMTGQILIAGGLSGGTATNSVELYDRGLGFKAAWQPLISTNSVSMPTGSAFTLIGSLFKGISEASGGNTANSSSNYPLVQLRSFDSSHVQWVTPVSWIDVNFTSAPVSGLPFGPTLMTMFTNGIPSASKLMVFSDNLPSNLVYSQNPASYSFKEQIIDNVPSSTGGAVTTYSISPALPAGLVLDTATGIISGTPTVLSSATNYTVTATNTGGSLAINLTISVGKGNQTISFTAITSNHTYGESPFLLNATASSGLPVGFTIVSGPATVVGDDATNGFKIVLNGAGSVTVRAIQNGDASYNPAPSVDQTFTVAKAPTVTSVTASPNPAHFGDSVTFSATVANNFNHPSLAPTGTVQFKDNGANLGSPQNVADGAATFTTSSLDSSAHVITAEYSGDANYGASVGALAGGEAVQRTVLANISTRLRVETADNVLIGGFIVTGTQPKRVIIRAIGPSLSVDGHLDDPVLELHKPDGTVIINDNWDQAENKQEIIDSTVAPSNEFESAILTVLPANNSAYTAVVRGLNGGTGVALVEVFDLDGSVDSKLANISTRGLVQTDNNVMIGGFIVLNGSQKVIVRAIGPSLPVDGALQDPLLELHDSNGNITTNDNWTESPDKQAIIDSTVAPTDPRESAILQTLVPGNYTAVVRGVNDTTGVALVEVFALQ